MYKRMPMGLKTASAHFCRFIDAVLGDMKGDDVLTYLDDLLIPTDTFEKHLIVLDAVFARLDKANITLGAKKCFLAKPEVNFLGHVVNVDGVKPDPTKTQAIEALQLPQSAEQLRSTLGTMSYYRKFILNYSTVEEPLRRKLENHNEKWRKDKDGKVQWTKEETDAFRKLQDALKSKPILQHPDWTQPFEIHTDASHKGLGALLCQRINGKEHVIYYASRAVSKAEASYSTWELECLAMVWATRLFRMYILGTKFKIYTDSYAAKCLLAANDAAAGGRLLRWRLALQEFEFDTHHRKGAKNGNADGLSRNFVQHEDPYGCGPTEIHPRTALNVHEATQENPEREHDDTHTKPKDLNQWRYSQENDPFCKSQMQGLADNDTRTRRRYKMSDSGLLLKILKRPGSEEKTTLVVPEKLQAFIMNQYHSLPVTGHKGRNKTRTIIKQRYYWPKMDNYIDRWVNACLVCAKRKRPRPLHSGNPASVCDYTRRWQALSIDLVEAGSTSLDSYRYILSAMCLFSRYVIAIPIKNKTAKEVAEALFTHVFAVHGKPERIHSDDGKEFINSGLLHLYRRWGIEPISTGGYRPWSNPVERFHRYLNTSMTMLASKFGEDWTSYLQAAVFSYNASACRSTGYSPYYIIHGKEPTLLEDVAMPHVHEDAKPEDINDITKRLTAAYQMVVEQQTRVAATNRRRLTKWQNIQYKTNDSILYWEPAQQKILSGDISGAARKAPTKWKDRWTGPHQITAVHRGNYGNRYTIYHTQRCESIENVKPDRLSPFQPWSASLPSTSQELDKNTHPFNIGSWCKPDQLFIIPLSKPWPFGVCKALETNDDSTISTNSTRRKTTT